MTMIRGRFLVRSPTETRW